MNESKLFVMGPTGAGKSTLIQFLYGCEFKRVKERGKIFLEPIDKDRVNQGFAMKKGLVSITKDVEMLILDNDLCGLKANEKLCVVDTPGFQDTEGWEADLENFLLLRKELKRSKETRFLLITEYSSLDTGRGSGMEQLMQDVISVLGGEKAIELDEELLESCIIGITHIPTDYALEECHEDVIKKFAEKAEAMGKSKKSRKQKEFQRLVLTKIVEGEMKLIMIDETLIDRKSFVKSVTSVPSLSNEFEYEMPTVLRNYILKKATESFGKLTIALNGEQKNFAKALDHVKEIEELSDLSRDYETRQFFNNAKDLVAEYSENFIKEIKRNVVDILSAPESITAKLEEIMAVVNSSLTEELKREIYEFLQELVDVLVKNPNRANFPQMVKILAAFGTTDLPIALEAFEESLKDFIGLEKKVPKSLVEEFEEEGECVPKVPEFLQRFDEYFTFKQQICSNTEMKVVLGDVAKEWESNDGDDEQDLARFVKFAVNELKKRGYIVALRLWRELYGLQLGKQMKGEVMTIKEAVAKLCRSVVEERMEAYKAEAVDSAEVVAVLARIELDFPDLAEFIAGCVKELESVANERREVIQKAMQDAREHNAEMERQNQAMQDKFKAISQQMSTLESQNRDLQAELRQRQRETERGMLGDVLNFLGTVVKVAAKVKKP